MFVGFDGDELVILPFGGEVQLGLLGLLHCIGWHGDWCHHIADIESAF